MSPLSLLLILTFLVTVDVRMLAPVLPSISISLGSSPGTIGLAMTTYSLAYGTGQLFYGPLSDRLGRIAVIRAAGVGFSICTILSALAVTTGQFILVRLLAGALAGAVIPLTLVFIGDTVEYERRQAVLGRFAVLTSAALAFSASIGGTVSHFVSWRFMLLGYGSLALIPLGLLWRINIRSSGQVEECADRFRDLLHNRYALFVYIGVFLEGFLAWGGMTYLGAFATHRYGLDQFTVGLLLALFGIGMMAGGLLMDRLRRLFSENTLAVSGGMLMGGSFLVLILRWPSPVFAGAMFILGLGYVCLHTTLQLRGTDISSTARGKAFSLFAFSLFLGLSTGSAAFGRLVDAGRYDAMFILVGAGLIGTGVATAFAPQHGTSPRRMKASDGTCIIHQS
jgi:MFS transporter, YNFM family, putative membrane transport protein